MTWNDLKSAMQAFIRDASGYAGNRVIWERQGKPRPTDDYISLSTSAYIGQGEDELITPDQYAPSDQATSEGIRIFTLHIRIFANDFSAIGQRIQNYFRSKEKAFLYLKKQQIVTMTILTIGGAPSIWTWLIEGGEFEIEYDPLTPPMASILSDMGSAINDATWLHGIEAHVYNAVADDPKRVEIISNPGHEFTFGTDDEKVTMVETQAAVDLSWRGDFGLQTVPDELRTNYVGTGALDVLLSTSSRLVEEAMQYIEKVEITNEGNGEMVVVDIDNPPA